MKTVMGPSLAMRQVSFNQSQPVHFERNVKKAEKVAEAELAAVARAEQKAVAYKQAYAPIPTFDYVHGRFNAALAQDFADKTFKVKGEALFTGKELLNLLMTRQAALPTNPPNVDRLSGFDLAQLGKTENSLRDYADSKGFHFSQIYEALREAQRYGLVYQMKDLKRGATYYGVPQNVRNVLNLTLPEEVKPVVEVQDAAPAKKALTPFGKTLAKLLDDAKDVYPKHEFFEFAAQLANSALEAGLINQDNIPESFKPTIANIGVTDSLPGAILTIFESALDGPFESLAKDLCQHGITEGLLDEQEYREVKDGRILTS